MKLTGKRVVEIIEAYARSHTIITTDFAHDLAAVSDDYNDIQILELFNSIYSKATDKLSPENIATEIWRATKQLKSLRPGDVFPLEQIAFKLPHYNNEELGKGLQELVRRGWLKDGKHTVLTLKGFNNL